MVAGGELVVVVGEDVDVTALVVVVDEPTVVVVDGSGVVVPGTSLVGVDCVDVVEVARG